MVQEPVQPEPDERQIGIEDHVVVVVRDHIGAEAAPDRVDIAILGVNRVGEALPVMSSDPPAPSMVTLARLVKSVGVTPPRSMTFSPGPPVTLIPVRLASRPHLSPDPRR